MTQRVAPTLDHPIDAGIVPIATVALTSAQLRQLAVAVKNHSGGIRIEVLPDGFVRGVLVADEGRQVEEMLLWPV
jgi:hypothetical protein